MRGAEGVLVVDKPAGPTSHDVVAQARRLFATRAVGHAGTLDPAATGVLLLLFGQAAKLSGYLTSAAKTYRVVVALGSTTTTDDAQGATTSQVALAPGDIDEARVEQALNVERERRCQRPPNVSAVRVGGERAHSLARRGETPPLAARPIAVERLELVSLSHGEVELEVTASKGYFVRALARDLGETLGVGAHVLRLRRLRSGPFSLDEASPWPPPSTPELIPTSHAARRALPAGVLTERGVERARHGKALLPEDFSQAPGSLTAAWLDQNGDLVAIGEAAGELFVVRRGFAP